MKKMHVKLLDVPDSFSMSALSIVAALFLCGAVAGCVTAAYVTDSSDGVLVNYLTNYLASVESGQTIYVSFWGAVFNSYKYHAVCFFFGFTALGMIIIPLTVAARGFFLSFAISTFVKILGNKGLILAAGVFGIPCLFTLPCLFIITSQAFSASASLLRITLKKERKNYEPIYGRDYFTKVVFCAVILLICAIFETFISPLIVSAVASYVY